MTTARLDGSPPVYLTLRRSSRARRFSLRVSRVDGRVTLTLPARARTSEALAFAHDHEGWIRTALAALPEVRRVVVGGAVPVEGVERRIIAGPVRAPILEDRALMVPDRAGAAGPRIATFLRHLAGARLREACDRHATALGRSYDRLVLRDTRSRWGSCSAEGRLMFSWRLILARPEVLDYVAAHEVAHLEEMNHSPAFWEAVAHLMPDYAAHRVWLRRHGAALHQVDFSS